MKIFIITQEEPFYLPIGLEKLVSQRRKEIVGATVLSRFGKTPLEQVLKKLFSLYGPKDFFLQASEFVLFKILDILTPIIKPKRFYSIRRIFDFFSVPIISTNNINDKNYLKKIKQSKPEIIISFGCPQVFKKEILSLPLFGCINVHGSLLPKYRGKNTGFWVLLNQEKETGVTVHYMNEKIDDGEIILQKKIKIHPQETVNSLYKKKREKLKMTTLKNKSILVTGGAGFIGSHLVDRLIKEKPKKIVVVDNFFLGNIDNLISAKSNFNSLSIKKQDARNYQKMKEIIEPPSIFLNLYG